ncbi:TPA: hypothetical protein DEP94_01555 [Candidatus Nomurabacteria bacterium]|nr:hypothetical protein [Candidatus Nomurabacteria bacterium]
MTLQDLFAFGSNMTLSAKSFCVKIHIMDHLENLKKKVSDLYLSKNDTRDSWADWLYENHIFLVADKAGELADKYGANRELAMASAMLHDIADAVMSRFTELHEEESFKIAKSFLKESNFSDEEIEIIVVDAMKFHSCRDGNIPKTLEGKVVATADAVTHLSSDFFEHAILEKKKDGMTIPEISLWAIPKIDRDFNTKIFFEDVRKEMISYYEKQKALFQ